MVIISILLTNKKAGVNTPAFFISIIQ